MDFDAPYLTGAPGNDKSERLYSPLAFWLSPPYREASILGDHIGSVSGPD